MFKLIIGWLLSSAVCIAGTINVSVTDNMIVAPFYAGANVNPNLVAAGVSTVVPPLGQQFTPADCMPALNPSCSTTTVFGTAQALTQTSTAPLSLTAQGSVTAVNAHTPSGEGFATEVSYTNLSVEPPAKVSTFSIFPSITMIFDPGGMIGHASALDSQGRNEVGDNLFIQVYMDGTTDGFFVLDPSSGTMALDAAPGDSGAIFTNY